MDDALWIGQAYPTAGVLTDLDEITANLTLSSIVATNHDHTVNDTISITLAMNGDADAAKQYIVHQLVIDADDGPYIFTGGQCARAGDVIRVYSLNGTTSFNASGILW